MDPQHRSLFVKWCQSKRIKLLVGEEAQKFLVPRELLRRRSREFRELLDKEDLSTDGIPLPETSVSTMVDFFVWLHTPQPQLDDLASFKAVIGLGVFASRYQVTALINQVTNTIRGKIVSGDWKLEAWIVDEVYAAAPANTPLREVVRAALGLVPQSSMNDQWESVFLKHAQLGWDYIKAKESKWTTKNYLSDVCRFHDHSDMPRREGEEASSETCTFAGDECYPTWEDDAVVLNGTKEEEPKTNGIEPHEEPKPEEEPEQKEPEEKEQEEPEAQEEEPKDEDETLVADDAAEDGSEEANDTLISESAADEANSAVAVEESVVSEEADAPAPTVDTVVEDKVEAIVVPETKKSKKAKKKQRRPSVQM